MKYGKFLIFIFTILLSGCLGPVQTEPSATYVLNTIPCHVPTKPARHITLLVLQPETRPVINTTQMAYTIKPFQVAYFGRNQWAETPSQMLEPLMVQSLQNTHYFHAVVTPPYTGRYDYMLSTQILQLQQDYVCCPNVVKFTLRAQLTRTVTNQVIATKQFTVVMPIRRRTPYSGVIAANEATAKILAELTEFCLQHM